MGEASASRWAGETFGGAALGDIRRVRRLVSMAAAAACQPAGTVCGTFDTAARREGAFRLLENGEIRTEAIAGAMFEATARRAGASRRVLVAVDWSSLTLADRARRREIGRIGSTRMPCRGLHVQSALAMDEKGAALGLLDQRWWSWNDAAGGGRNRKCHGRSYLKRTTRHWVDGLDEMQQRLGGRARAWYQLDRGADCWPLLRMAVEEKLLLTVRSRCDRRLLDVKGKRRFLDSTLRRAPELGRFELELPARGTKPSRMTTLVVRAARVPIFVRVASKRREVIEMNAVLVEEPRGAGDRLSWQLLTTHPIKTFAHAKAVADAYTTRWRVEDFHRTWKRGLCNVEKTQLQSRAAITKWATILAAVAARAVRLANLYRTAPTQPAETEFTEDELDALFLLRRQKRDKTARFTVAEIIALIAENGGWSKYSPKNPGPTVLGRGLERMTIFAEASAALREMR